MYFSRDTDGAITLNFGAGSSPMVIGQDSDGYIVLDYGGGGSTPLDIPNYGRDNAAARLITYTNADGEAMILTEYKLDPFVLCKADGIYSTENDIRIKDNAMLDGGTFYGSTMKVRNIVLTIKDIQGHDANREFVDVVFDKNKPGILQVLDGTHNRAIECYVESVNTTATPVTRLTTISLICPDPYFYDPNYTNVYIASLVPAFEFEHEFSEYGEEIGAYNDTKLGTIVNRSADNNIGMIIIIKADGDVVNPVITLVETQEYIAVGTADKPYTLHFGDTLTIYTVQGKKNVYDGSGDSVNAYLDEDSTFFQIKRGVNTIGYDSDSGADHISITIMYRYKYVRA